MLRRRIESCIEQEAVLSRGRPRCIGRYSGSRSISSSDDRQNRDSLGELRVVSGDRPTLAGRVLHSEAEACDSDDIGSSGGDYVAGEVAGITREATGIRSRFHSTHDPSGGPGSVTPSEQEMNAGYVYILVNSSMPGVIKVGRTLRDTRARARELSTSGVPTPFQVAFELFSEDHATLEARVHTELADFRVSPNREFFRYPLDRAIALLQRFNSPPKDSESQFAAEDITVALKTKYPGYLRPEIVAVRIVQVPNRVWLEVAEEEEVAGYLKDQRVRRTDLAFIVDTDELYFRPQDDVQLNASKFVGEFHPYSIIMTTDLFTEQACDEVSRLHNHKWASEEAAEEP